MYTLKPLSLSLRGCSLSNSSASTRARRAAFLASFCLFFSRISLFAWKLPKMSSMSLTVVVVVVVVVVVFSLSFFNFLFFFFLSFFSFFVLDFFGFFNFLATGKASSTVVLSRLFMRKFLPFFQFRVLVASLGNR